MKKFFRKLKRGITLAETVVSMAIITVISVSTISVVEMGTIQSSKSKSISELKAIANNAYEAFKFSDSFSSYLYAMSLAQSEFVSYKKDENLEKYYLTYQAGKYEEVVTIEYTETIDTFSVVCNDNDEVLYTFSLSKLHETEVIYDE